MTKSDQIVHHFTIYEIKRHTIKPHEFRWTKFYEDNSSFQQIYPGIGLDISADELIICSTVVNADNYSLLTTRRVVTKEKGIESIGYMAEAITYKMPLNYKFEKYGYALGTIQLRNGDVLRYFLETAKASMVMIYGIITLIWSQQLTDAQMVNLIRLSDKRKKANF